METWGFAISFATSQPVPSWNTRLKNHACSRPWPCMLTHHPLFVIGSLY